MAVVKLGEGLPTSFYGKVVRFEKLQSGVRIVTGDGVYLLSSDKDPGLSFLPEGKKCHVVISEWEILAIYLRPRIKLFQFSGAGIAPTWDFLKSLNPKYLIKQRVEEK